MLSIDITDKQIRLVRGSLSGTKIRIIQIEQRPLQNGCVENGFITDIPMVASEIAEILATLDIKDKDTIVCINSSLILYKELVIPKPKKLSNSIQIESMIQSNMNISSDYNISYSIVGETVDEEKHPMIRVMATACPQRMVDGYVRLFSHLGLNLKSINISNNCITRLVAHNQKLNAVMPLLLVQIDANFISINLYDEGQLVISRYIKIDQSDYDDEPDYLNQATYENIFHMIQFIESRQNSRPIKEIMFYGNIPDFISLSNAISPFNIPSHVISMPTNVVSFCEINFAEVANAVGAFFRPRKDLDHVNLLESNAAKEKKAMSKYSVALGLIILISLLSVTGITMGVKTVNENLVAQAKLVRSEISSPDVLNRTTALTQKINILNNITQYADNVDIARQIFNFKPKIYSDVLAKLEEPLTAGMKIVNEVTVSEYSVSATYTCTKQEQPAEYVAALVEQGYFENITYTGFSVEEGNDKSYTFTISMLLKGGNAVEAE